MSCGISVYPPAPIIVSQLPSTPVLLADNLVNPTTSLLGSCGLVWNGTTWERDQPQVEGTLLTSASVNFNRTSATQTNRGARGVLVWLNITLSVGSGAVFVLIQAQDPVSGNWANLNASVAGISVASTYGFELSPGAAGGGAPLPGIHQRTSGGLPRTWRAVGQFTGGTSIEYSVGFQYIR